MAIQTYLILKYTYVTYFNAIDKSLFGTLYQLGHLVYSKKQLFYFI